MAQQILIIQTAFLGDLLLAIPLIKRAKCDGDITLLCRDKLGDYFLKTGLVKNIVNIDKKNKSTYKDALGHLLSQQFDLILCPHQSFRSALLCAKLRAPRKIGFKKKWNAFAFSERVARDKELPDALRQLSLYTPLDKSLEEKFGALSVRLTTSEPIPQWASMGVDYPQPDRKLVQKLNLSLEKKWIFLSPGSVWGTKRWIPYGFISVGKNFAKQNFEVVLIGSPEEREDCEQIASQIPHARNIAGEPSLFELGCLMKRGSLLISNDNGAMHLGATANLPTVAIFGPTVLRFGYRPWNSSSIVVEREGLACRPCGTHGRRVCPLGTHECMTSISPEQILFAARKLENSSHQL